MATLVSRFRPTRLDWGWTTQYVDRGNPVTLRPGQRLALLPRHAGRTSAQHLAKGLTHLYVNNGYSGTAVPVAQRAMIDNCGDLYNALGGGNDPRQWASDPTRMRNAIRAYFGDGKAGFMTGEPGEKFNHISADAAGSAAVWGNNDQGKSNGMPLDVWNSSQSGKLFDQFASEILSEKGCTWYGDYGGHFNFGKYWFSDLGRVRTALSSPAEAYKLAQAEPCFGNAFYSGENWRVRDGLIKFYSSGDPDIHRMLNQWVTYAEVDRLARIYKNINRRVCGFCFFGYLEPMGAYIDGTPRTWHVNYKRTLDNGGVVNRQTFPLWSVSLQVWFVAYLLMRGFDVMGWESADCFGDNPNVVYQGDAAAGVTYNGPAVTRASSTNSPGYTTDPVGFPYNPQGMYDIGFEGANLFTYLSAWAGFDMEWASFQIKPMGGQYGAFTTAGAEYVTDRFVDNTGYALVGKQTINGVQRRSILFVLTGKPAGKPYIVNVNIDGGFHEFKVYPDTYYAANLQL